MFGSFIFSTSHSRDVKVGEGKKAVGLEQEKEADI